MPSLDISDTGLASLAIKDADGEVRQYRLRCVPPGLSLWALELTRADTEAVYRIREERPVRPGVPAKWLCDCPAEKYRKRGADHCKHIAAARAFRAWLRLFLDTWNERDCSPNGSADRAAV